MKKIPYNSFLQSMTLFFVNDNIDKKYANLRKEKINQLKAEMSLINSRAGLQNYIRTYEDSLSNLLVILGVSNEMFKHVISMFRIQLGMIFQTEWDAKQTRKYMLTNDTMMERVCNLFLKGSCDASLKAQLPGFKLANFIIDDNVMNRLKNDDFLAFLINKEFDTQYNSDLSNANIAKIDDTLNEICKIWNLKLVRAPKVDPIGNGTRDIQVNYAIECPGKNLPIFYLKYSFNITTSRGQTDFKRSIKDLRDFIRNKNVEAKQIVVLDGAGWIGRQSDLRDAWDYCDYCLNLQHIEDLKEIIKL